ncbi:MAG: hypothetical protein H6Q56_1016 [Deltaproteobacteria bacterium]|nr:hypothetical protein [Deltaproteobacteria bacterium]
MALSPDLIAILVCPQCKGKLAMEPAESGFICPACRLRYPIREGIPVMLADEAEKI